MAAYFDEKRKPSTASDHHKDREQQQDIIHTVLRFLPAAGILQSNEVSVREIYFQHTLLFPA